MPDRTASRLINTSILALPGFLLLHLALSIEPSNGFLRSRLAMARRWAIVVVVAFLLLLPLQGYATWLALALALPLAELKRSLLGELEETQDRAAGRISGVGPADLWALSQGMARVTIASLGYATAFAAAAQRPRSSQTLLQSLAGWVEVRQGRRPRPPHRSP
jgi:hypothetical protein